MIYGFHLDGSSCHQVACTLKHIAPEDDGYLWERIKEEPELPKGMTREIEWEATHE